MLIGFQQQQLGLTSCRRRRVIDQETTECSMFDASIVDLADSTIASDDRTSADYYFDSYSHFGIHEVSLQAGWILCSMLLFKGDAEGCGQNKDIPECDL